MSSTKVQPADDSPPATATPRELLAQQLRKRRNSAPSTPSCASNPRRLAPLVQLESPVSLAAAAAAVVGAAGGGAAPPQRKGVERFSFAGRTIKQMRKTITIMKSGMRKRAPLLRRHFDLYQPPRQLIQWGDAHPHGHTNWFDLFFDLIFVGAALQLGSLLKASLDLRGCGYFGAMALALQTCWSNRLYYDARVDTDDLLHKALDMLGALTVAAAALHIGSGASGGTTPVQDMEKRQTGHAWGFSVSLLALRLLDAARWWEVHRQAESAGAASLSRAATKEKVKASAVYLVAAVFSNSQWTPDWPNGSAWAAALWCTGSLYEQHTFHACSRRQRGSNVLLLSPTKGSRTLGGRAGPGGSGGGRRSSAQRTLEATTVPVHTDYCLHRYGEWVMLMIGESMLSLVVGVRLADTLSFYAVFTAGFVSAVALQFLHYSTQPFEREAHAMHRSPARAGLLWQQCIAHYSVALIAFGVALKVLLANHDKPALKPKYAWLACGSLGAAYAILQFMRACHGGLDAFIVDCGLHDTLPRWLFDSTVAHRTPQAGGKSPRQLAAARTRPGAASAAKKRKLAAAKVLLLLGLVVLPLAGLRALWISVGTAVWSCAVVVLEALSRADDDAAAAHSSSASAHLAHTLAAGSSTHAKETAGAAGGGSGGASDLEKRIMMRDEKTMAAAFKISSAALAPRATVRVRETEL